MDQKPGPLAKRWVPKLRSENEREVAKAAEGFAEDLIRTLERFAAPRDAAKLLGFLETITVGWNEVWCHLELQGAAIAARFDRLLAIMEKWDALPEPARHAAKKAAAPSPGDLLDVFAPIAHFLHAEKSTKERWAERYLEMFSRHVPVTSHGWLAMLFVLDGSGRVLPLVATLALRSPLYTNAEATRDSFLRNAIRPLYSKSKLNWKEYAKALLAEASNWKKQEVELLLSKTLFNPDNQADVTPRALHPLVPQLKVLESFAHAIAAHPAAAKKVLGLVKKARDYRPIEWKPPVARDPLRIADFGLKLALTNAVMFELGLLPRFDVYEFAKSYAKRSIDIDEEGYEPIPEVLAYFKKLELERKHLERIERLSLDGGDSIYLQLCPLWDGEDDGFDVKSLRGIEHCIRLQEIDLTVLASFPAKQLAILGKLPALRRLKLRAAQGKGAERVLESLRERGVVVEARQ